MIEDTHTVHAARDEGSSRAVAVSAVRAGLACRCPRCGEGRLFDGLLKVRPACAACGLLKVRPACAACGLDLAAIQTGDGPATFIMQIAGFIVGFSALFMEIRFHPPMWLHLLIWLPLVVILSLALMRPGRALMIALQYRNQTDERSSPVPPRASGKEQ